MAMTGECHCGAVSFTVSKNTDSFSACHCEMCRKITSGAFMSLQTDIGDVTFTGEDMIKEYQSSPWAKRAFCSNCGSSLYYQVTAPGPMAEHYQLALGLMKDIPDDFSLELFVDTKPQAYEFAGARTKLTAAQVQDMFGG